MRLHEAIYDRQVQDDALIGMLATYHGEPAIFTTDPVPPDAPTPYIVWDGADLDEHYGAKNEEGRDIRVRLRIYDDARGSTQRIDDIAAREFALFHRRPLSLDDGWENYVVDVSGPFAVSTDPDLYGRSVLLRFLIRKPVTPD